MALILRSIAAIAVPSDSPGGRLKAMEVEAEVPV
jgi:hypothetical protein